MAVTVPMVTAVALRSLELIGLASNSVNQKYRQLENQWSATTCSSLFLNFSFLTFIEQDDLGLNGNKCVSKKEILTHFLNILLCVFSMVWT